MFKEVLVPECLCQGKMLVGIYKQSSWWRISQIFFDKNS